MERMIVGLDLGTYTMKAAAAGIGPGGEMSLLVMREIPSRGISRGNITDLAEASGTVERLMSGIKEECGHKIFKVALSVGGAGFSSDRSMGSLVLHGSPKELTHHDMEKVIQAARNMSFSLDRFILHEMVEGYILDGQEGVRNPLGLFTKKLEVRLYTLFHNMAYMQNVIRCINYAGYDVAKIAFSGLAAINCLVREDELANGVAFIDIGHETTKIVVATDGRIQFCNMLNAGSADITRSISEKFKIPFSFAEKLKLDSDIAPGSKGEERISISIANKRKDIAKSEVKDIVRDKVEELLDAIRKELNRSSLLDGVKSGIVLAGGGALLEGLPAKAEEFFNLPTRTGLPKLSPADTKKPPHLFASCIGALRDYAREINERRFKLEFKHPISRLAHSVANFLNDYF